MQLQDVLYPTRLIKTFLQDKPDLMQTYVDWATVLVNQALSPLGAIILHLIDVQGLDPEMSSIQKYRKDLEAVLNGVRDDHEYDSEYDLSWVTKKWHETNRGLNGVVLTQQKFRELTDLHEVSDKVPDRVVENEDEFFANTTEINRVAPPAPKREIDIALPQRVPDVGRDRRRQEIIDRVKSELDLETKKGRQDYRKLVAEEATLKDDEKFDPGGFMAPQTLNENTIKNSVDALEKLLKDMEERTSTRKVKSKKVNKSTKTRKSGYLFSRKAVKEEEEIQCLIKKGTLDLKDVAALVCEGLSQESVDCWKSKYDNAAEDKFKGNFRRASSKG